MEQGRQKNIKVPSFDGKEDWKVWQSRFKVIAWRLGWTDEEELDNLFPILQGAASEFVFAEAARTRRREESEQKRRYVEEFDRNKQNRETESTRGVQEYNGDEKNRRREPERDEG